MQINKKEIKSILVVNLGGIGDLLLSTPALRALKQHFSGASLYLLVAKRVREAVKDLPYVDKIFILEIGHPWINGLANLRNLVGLRKQKIDLAINMRTLVSDSSALKMKLLMQVINPGIKAGRNTSGRGGFLDIKVPEDDRGKKYEMEYDIDMVSALGAAVIDKQIDFKIDEKSSLEVQELLNQNGIGLNDILIGIHPGGRPSRRWPEENFASTIQRIKDNFAVSFVITGGKDEAGLATRIIAESNVKVLNLTGKLSFAQLGALIKRCDLYITNDTGMLHIAAVLGTPLVAIFGSGHLKRFDPRNISEKSLVLYKKSDCSPCNKFFCPSVKCLKAISVNEVVEAAAVFLE
ncbi:MAG: glycosyltransferase family 9 protein, partial [Candidatus Omnitrophica bacterium]|nr:glycosyltransferase family 9 protein [Candidatus Omnitrophota bacterium]